MYVIYLDITQNSTESRALIWIESSYYSTWMDVLGNNIVYLKCVYAGVLAPSIPDMTVAFIRAV